jgi:hypothetical protein
MPRNKIQELLHGIVAGQQSTDSTKVFGGWIVLMGGKSNISGFSDGYDALEEIMQPFPHLLNACWS